MHEGSFLNSPLPLSVEKAYHRKCVALKKRLDELEQTNDAARLRIHRVERAIAKMRTERALLMERLHKRQARMPDDISEKSTPPQSPRERAPKRKRSGYRTASAYDQPLPLLAAAEPSHEALHNRSSTYPSNLLNAPPHSYPPSHSASMLGPPAGFPPGKSATNLPLHASQLQGQQLPLIHSLPNGTSVMLVAPGVPKPAPWTIQELDPRHHYNAQFNDLPLELQEIEIFEKQYLPFDPYGQSIYVTPNEATGKYIQYAPGQPGWRDPVKDSIRIDASPYQRRMQPPRGIAGEYRSEEMEGGVALPEHETRDDSVNHG